MIKIFKKQKVSAKNDQKTWAKNEYFSNFKFDFFLSAVDVSSPFQTRKKNFFGQPPYSWSVNIWDFPEFFVTGNIQYKLLNTLDILDGKVCLLSR